MPLVADPGYELVQAALERGVEVVPIPGPTALALALTISGLPAVPFVFLGFAPRKSAARRQLLAAFAGDRRTLVLYESPHRLASMLRDAAKTLGPRQVAVACELTKMYEEVWRGTLDQAAAHFERNKPRGEFVLVIGGAEKGSG